MTISGFGRYTLGICAAVAVLGGCNSGGSQLIGVPLAPSASHASQRGSWINSDAKGSALLYVVDSGNNLVDIYDYKTPNKGLVGQLTGFDHPVGDCSDAEGNVYITIGNKYDAGPAARRRDIFEYAHGSTTLIKALYVEGKLSGGCSIDPATGNLAVSTYSNYGPSADSGVWVFAGAKGHPTEYQDPSPYGLSYYPSPGYDNQGNLFVEATGCFVYPPPPMNFDELPRGGNALIPLTTNFSIPNCGGGGVTWDGSYLAVGTGSSASSSTLIYRVTVSNGTATAASSLNLTDGCSSYYLPQFWIMGHTLVGGSSTCHGSVGYWSYPHGGFPKKTIRPHLAPKSAAGATISL